MADAPQPVVQRPRADQQQQQKFICIPIYIDGIAHKKEISKNK